MENRIIKSILCLIVVLPVMAFAHTNITGSEGKDEIALTSKLIEEHWPLNSSSIQEFELAEARKAINMHMRFCRKAALSRLFLVKEYSR